MKPSLSSCLVQAAAASMLLTGAPALADPPHCPPGLERQGRCDPRDRDWRDRRDEARAYREGYRAGQRDAWRRGDRLEGVNHKVIRDYHRYDLAPPPPGHYYAEVDGEVLLVVAATRIVADLIGG